jgi:circadian clock protein KaiC
MTDIRRSRELFEVPNPAAAEPLAKAPTGIVGFDEITFGGLPRGRATLITGGAGSGKTLFGLEFLVRGAEQFGEPGVLLTFEESEAELATNVASLGFDLAKLERDGLLVVDAFRLDVGEIITTGAFDLEGLFIRLGMAIAEVGAQRVVLDTVDVLFTALGDETIVRAELSRLLRWLKDRGLTVVITGEQGKSGALTRFGIEEYVSDCVVVLDHRIAEQLSTRRLRIAKYRGSLHGTNEYPFLITDQGLAILPMTSVGLAHEALTTRVSTGIPRLDHMLGGGPFTGSTMLVSGASGTGKTTIAVSIADAACARGERALVVSFEESPKQIIRNMASVGTNLQRWIDAGLLHIWCVRRTAMGLEEHLVELLRHLDEHRPELVVLDATGSLAGIGTPEQVRSAVSRQIDILKSRGITAVFTELMHGTDLETSVVAVSSLVDTWVLLRNFELNGERNRLLYVIKSRGTKHSNQVREFVITDDGPDLIDPYLAGDLVLTGSARIAQLARDRAAAQARTDDVDRRRRALDRRAEQVEQQVNLLRSALAEEQSDFDQFLAEAAAEDDDQESERLQLSSQRWAEEPPNEPGVTP